MLPERPPFDLGRDTAPLTPPTLGKGRVGITTDKQSPIGVSRGQVAELEKCLWSGFSGPAVERLERLRTTARDPRVRCESASVMANWFYCRRDFRRAFRLARFADSFGQESLSPYWLLILQSEALLELGQTDKARSLLKRHVAGGDLEPNLCLAYANCFAGDPSFDAFRLELINRVLERDGLAPVGKKIADAPLTIKNLIVPEADRATIPEAPRVSVIMPVYNNVATVRTAIEGMMKQTWPNLELIIVDDASTDGSWDVIQSIAANHANIKTLRQTENRGNYSARNLGLSVATGDFITTHDGDDWSHPQKIEEQWRQISARAGCLGSRSRWVRVTDALRFVFEWQPRNSLIGLNPSSFMFRRSILADLGGWDWVRASGDGEFIGRAEQAFGTAAFIRIRQAAPFSFGLQTARSLTGRRETNFESFGFGLRRDYLDAARWWWPQQDRLYVDPNEPSRLYPAPRRLLPDRPEPPPYCALLVDDFSRPKGTRSLTKALIRTATESGRRIGVFHWHHLAEPGIRAPLDPAIWALAAEGVIDVISAGDKVTADALVFPFAPILRFAIDRTPDVSFGQLFVIDGTLGPRGAALTAEDRRIASNVLAAAFGERGTWIGDAEAVRAVIFGAPDGK